MTNRELGPADVTQEQVNELRGDLWVPLVLLTPMFAFAVVSMNLPAAGFLGAATAAWVALATPRSHSPTRDLGSYPDPISKAVLRTDGLEARGGEDALELRIRAIHTIDTLNVRPWTVGRASRRIARSAAFVSALTGVGFLTPPRGIEPLFFALFGAALGLVMVEVMVEVPKRRRVAKATAVLRQQLEHLGSQVVGSAPSGEAVEAE